jgi:hypothetical protein
MTVKDLKELLETLPDDMQVLVPIHPMESFTGEWFSPCIEESQVTEMGLDEEGDETEKSFTIVPCGYYNVHEGPPVEMN